MFAFAFDVESEKFSLYGVKGKSVNLTDTFDFLGQKLGLRSGDLIEFAREDGHGGYHPGFDDGCMIGSLFRVEGQILYALIRALEPEVVIEIGSLAGCSSEHLAAALKANGTGKLFSVDNHALGQTPEIPKGLEGVSTFIDSDGVNYLASLEPESVDFIFEDASHETDMVAAVWAEGKRVLKPGGLIISHDAAHWVVGDRVVTGIRLAGVEPIVVLTDPSDCGLGIWRKPAAETTKAAKEPATKNVESEPVEKAVKGDSDVKQVKEEKEPKK